MTEHFSMKKILRSYLWKYCATKINPLNFMKSEIRSGIIIPEVCKSLEFIRMTYLVFIIYNCLCQTSVKQYACVIGYFIANIYPIHGQIYLPELLWSSLRQEQLLIQSSDPFCNMKITPEWCHYMYNKLLIDARVHSYENIILSGVIPPPMQLIDYLKWHGALIKFIYRWLIWSVFCRYPDLLVGSECVLPYPL